MSSQSLCVHAHFYQPPREDPFTGLIPSEAGAAPFNNWNERIHAECYRPNAELRNFERISFNIGPTLYSWMDDFDPEVSRMIAAQDRVNLQRYGVGNAMAQPYNHTILPLASRADKITQVRWGIADFQHRYGRKPQGMWLPETAVDMETLSILAEHGIEFTILAPWQADCENLDSTEPYRVTLPDGKSITVFFYHRELSSEVSFNPNLTSNADLFAKQELFKQFVKDKTARDEPQLILIATDGELYGHHQKFRDHFLAHLVNGASSHLGITLTFPALWLKSHAAQRTISIREKTSWSCHHGIMRWRGECPCTSGDGRWKVYLRQSLNRLAATIDVLYAGALWPLKVNPWRMRDQYIHVILGEQSAEDLIYQMAGRYLEGEHMERIRLLLEAQRERQRFFTSCGWYFDDFGRIEPRNNVTYAAQAVYLTRLATGVDLTPQVIPQLKNVISHRTGLRGDMVFLKQLQRAGQLA